MPTYNRRNDGNYYIVGNPPEVGYITYQVSPRAEAFYESLEFSDGDELPWRLVRPLRIVRDLYTENEGGPREVNQQEVKEFDGSLRSELTNEEEQLLREHLDGHPRLTDIARSKLPDDLEPGRTGNGRSHGDRVRRFLKGSDQPDPDQEILDHLNAWGRPVEQSTESFVDKMKKREAVVNSVPDFAAAEPSVVYMELSSPPTYSLEPTVDVIKENIPPSEWVCSDHRFNTDSTIDFKMDYVTCVEGAHLLTITVAEGRFQTMAVEGSKDRIPIEELGYSVSSAHSPLLHQSAFVRQLVEFFDSFPNYDLQGV